MPSLGAHRLAPLAAPRPPGTSTSSAAGVLAVELASPCLCARSPAGVLRE